MELNDKIVPKGKEKEEKGNVDKVSKSGFFARMKKDLTEGLMVLGVASAVAVAAPGCGSNNEETAPPVPEATDSGCVLDGSDGGECVDGDAGPVEGGDVEQDAATEASVGQDTGVDQVTGPTSDADIDQDAGSVTEASVGQDGSKTEGGVTEVDASPDVVDAGPKACGAATTGSYVGGVGKTTPVTVGGYAFTYVNGVKAEGGNIITDVVVGISCDGVSVDTGKECKMNLPCDVPVTKDGKKITITPYQAGPTTIKAGIEVRNL
jgi:hypothetical protein